MPAPIYIDGSFGEGGDQVLRTALSLAAITGRPLRISRIRAGRRHPGLAPQHLTGVQALAKICRARVSGDRIGAQIMELNPNPAKPEIPKLKFQIPNNSQAPNANDPNTECADQKIFGIWVFGIWNFKVLPKTDRISLDRY